MSSENSRTEMHRREFLKCASLGAAAVSASSAAKAAPPPTMRRDTSLPTVTLGDRQVTRLIAGYNPIGGYSHFNTYLSRHMREYFTVDRTVEFLAHCEALGINTWQLDLNEKTMTILDKRREQGTQMNFLCLHGNRPTDEPLKKVKEYGAFAVAHHGGVTDAKFRGGRAEEVHDYVKRVHDLGMLAGVSSHNPANVRQVAEEGWENDFFMTCFHHISRTKPEMEAEFGTAMIGEPFVEVDPVRMTEVIRQVDKPCLAFKILAAGRKCDNRGEVGRAFKWAFENIKPGDAVIVGMFPREEDQAKDNVEITRLYA